MKKAIDQVISDVMSKNRESDTVRLASNGRLVVPRVSTQCRSLDRAVGGGMPLGRIVEIYGDAGCGKTTLGLHLLSEIQNQGGHAYFIDMETALDLEYAGEILDLDDLVMIEPSTGEDMFGIMWDIIRSKKEHDPDTPGVMIIDSLAGIVTQREIDAIAKGGFEK